MATPAETSGSKPFRAILWKEWRESWGLLLLAVIAPCTGHIAMPENPTQEWIFVTPAIVFIALCMGARLFAGEYARGTAHFRDECPAGRGLVWAATVTLPIAALLLGVLAKAVFGLCISLGLVPPHKGLFLVQILAEGLLAFAIGAFLSVIMDRPIIAVGAGGVICTAGVVLLAALTFHGIVTKSPPESVWALAAVCYALAIYLLYLSRKIFVRWRRD